MTGGMYPQAGCLKGLELELLKRNRYSRENFTAFVTTFHSFRKHTTWSNDYQLVLVLTNRGGECKHETRARNGKGKLHSTGWSFRSWQVLGTQNRRLIHNWTVGKQRVAIYYLHWEWLTGSSNEDRFTTTHATFRSCRDNWNTWSYTNCVTV